jgi:hypothetical protein
MGKLIKHLCCITPLSKFSSNCLNDVCIKLSCFAQLNILLHNWDVILAKFTIAITTFCSLILQIYTLPLTANCHCGSCSCNLNSTQVTTHSWMFSLVSILRLPIFSYNAKHIHTSISCPVKKKSISCFFFSVCTNNTWLLVFPRNVVTLVTYSYLWIACI